MKGLALATITLCIGGLSFGCAAVERAMPHTLSDANLVSLLLTIDVNEVEVVQLANEKTLSNPVRTYATHLVDDHTIMLQKHLRVANRIKPDKPNLASALEQTHYDTMEALHTKSGEDFDRAFIAHQVVMHVQTLKLLDDMEDSADDFSLKVDLDQARPELLIHLIEAQYLQRQLMAQQEFHPRPTNPIIWIKLHELDREWDIEHIQNNNAATVSLISLERRDVNTGGTLP